MAHEITYCMLLVWGSKFQFITKLAWFGPTWKCVHMEPQYVDRSIVSTFVYI